MIDQTINLYNPCQACIFKAMKCYGILNIIIICVQLDQVIIILNLLCNDT